MVEAETKTDFIGISSTIKKKGREGYIQVLSVSLIFFAD